MASRGPDNEPQVLENCAALWFALLEQARHDGDHDLERRAHVQLAKLGVYVCFESARTEQPRDGDGRQP